MFWVPSSITARRLLAATLLFTASAAAADILVVRSTGPSAKSFPPGKRIAETARIILKAGDRLVVLDGRGTRTLSGPVNVIAGVAPAAGRIASATPTVQRRARIGAVRGVGNGELRSPSIWHADVAESTTFCVAGNAGPTLWRADPSNPLTIDLTRVADGVTRRVAWDAGASTLNWPADLSVRDGSEFRLSWSGASTPTSLKIRTLPQKPAGLENMASSLISNNCTAQLDLLIETVRLPADAPPAG